MSKAQTTKSRAAKTETASTKRQGKSKKTTAARKSSTARKPKAAETKDAKGGTDFSHIHTTLAYHWYDEIAAGRKEIEFRENKPYWRKRLVGHDVETITFTRGYTSESMTWEVKCVDLVYYAETKEELREWAPKLRKWYHFALEDCELVPDAIFAIELGKRIK